MKKDIRGPFVVLSPQGTRGGIAVRARLTPPEPWKADDYADELLARLNSLGVVTLTEHADAPGHTPELWRRRLK